MMNSLRVLIVSEPGLDGVFRHVEGLVAGLLHKRIPVAFAYSSIRSSDRLFELVRRVNEAPEGRTVDLEVGNFPEVGDVGAARSLCEIIEQWKPTVVHSHSSKAGGVIRLLAAMGVIQVPVLYTPNAYYEMNSPISMRRGIFHNIERLLSQIGYTINVSRDEGKFAEERLGVRRRNRLILNNAVDFSQFQPASSQRRRKIREALGIPDWAWVVGSVSRFSWQKDPLTLVAGFCLAALKDPRLYLFMVGKGSLAAPADNMIVDAGLTLRYKRIEFMEDPLEAYQAFDVFALASRYEGQAFSILEAMACDLPLILTECPGNRGFGQLGLPGITLVPCEHSEIFADSINQSVYSSRSLLPGAVRESARRYFSLERANRNLIRLYDEVQSHRSVI